MANSGLTGGLTSLLGIDTDAGNAELQQALAALQAVGVPTAEMLNLPELEKYVSAGVLSPQQYQAIIADPEAYSNAIAANEDNSGAGAQKESIEALNSIIQGGGSTPIMQAQLNDSLNQTNQANKASREGIISNARERGASGGGLEFINQLMAEQGNSENASNAAVNASANNARLALDAISQKGQLGGAMQGQANQSAQAQAEAARQIAEYNSTLKSAANQYNTQNANDAMAANLANSQDISDKNVTGANDRMKYNAAVPQQVFQDQMAKAGGMADVYGKQATNAQNQAQMGAGLTGGLLGAGATVYGNSLMKPKSGAVMAKKPAQDEYPYFANGGQVMHQPAAAPAPSGGGHSGGIPKEALFALAGVMAAYPILRHSFGGGAPEQTSLNQDMGTQPMGMQNDPMNMAHGGQCYAQGGEVHDHKLCMKAGGEVPGDDTGMPPMMDDESQDTVPANLSPDEIVLPRSVAQSPNAPEEAANFVGNIKGQQGGTPQMGNISNFADVLSMLEQNGLELRLSAKGSM